jgi:hypothetical protein
MAPHLGIEQCARLAQSKLLQGTAYTFSEILIFNVAIGTVRTFHCQSPCTPVVSSSWASFGGATQQAAELSGRRSMCMIFPS